MRFLGFLLALLVAAPMAAAAEFKIDMAEIRRLADEMPGEKASEIRVETIGAFAFPWSMVIEGGEEAEIEMALVAFQLVFPERTALIDVAFGKEPAANLGVTGWNDAGSARLDAAMDTADFMVVTHEHFDHIGRIVARAGETTLLKRTKLTAEQIARPEDMEGIKWPEGALKDYPALVYDRVQAIAPGVVLIKAAGHTPGSQLVYVKTASGGEYLFLGDAAWQWRNVAEVKNRSAETVKGMNEDNDAVLAQLAEFNRLSKEEPALAIIPGHDGAVVTRLVGEGRLIADFK